MAMRGTWRRSSARRSQEPGLEPVDVLDEEREAAFGRERGEEVGEGCGASRSAAPRPGARRRTRSLPPSKPKRSARSGRRPARSGTAPRRRSFDSAAAVTTSAPRRRSEKRAQRRVRAGAPRRLSATAERQGTSRAPRSRRIASAKMRLAYSGLARDPRRPRLRVGPAPRRCAPVPPRVRRAPRGLTRRASGAPRGTKTSSGLAAPLNRTGPRGSKRWIAAAAASVAASQVHRPGSGASGRLRRSLPCQRSCNGRTPPRPRRR